MLLACGLALVVIAKKDVFKQTTMAQKMQQGPIALGCKNYLFSGNNSGAEDDCILYILLGSCLQAGIEPHQWLKSTLEKTPNLETPINQEELLP